MKDFQKTLKELRELSTISEETKALLEKMTGKELVDYESIDALVGALMTHYNGELKKKAQTSHNHDERYYTEGEIDTKFKNLSLVPVPVGGVLMMYNTSNPAELYVGTTWELLPADKYLKTGNTPLQQGGSNSFTISKANLPAMKLQVESFSLTRGTMEITGSFKGSGKELYLMSGTGAITPSRGNRLTDSASRDSSDSLGFTFTASKSWVGNTSSASPYTTAMGNGTAISINPSYITVRAWKRLS